MSSSNVVQLRTRKPTGKPGWPRILLTGAEGCWKSGTAALLSADERLGTMFWVEIGLGEQTADEYGALPGVDYMIVEHDGTWLDMYEQLGAAWDVAKAAEEAGEPPIPLGIDAMSGIHSMLMDMGDDRARKKAAQKLADKNQSTAVAWSADYDPTMSPDLWNLIRKRNRQLMAKILTWPGPVVMTSRERMATVFVNDKPTPNKDWSLECRKDLPSDITAWVRLFGGGKAEIRKLRSAKAAMNVELTGDSPQVRDFSVATLVFDWVGCEAGVSRAARVVIPNADQDMPDEVTHIEQRAQNSQQGPRDGRQQSAARQRPTAPSAGVERAAKRDAAASAAKGVDVILGAASMLEAVKNARVAKESVAFDFFVEGLLGGKDAVVEALGITPGERITLDDLGQRVAAYWSKNQIAPGTPVDAAPAAPTSPARQALEEHADEILTAHNGDQVTRGELEEFVRDDTRMRREAVA